MEARIRCSYPVTGFSCFRREPARNKHNLPPYSCFQILSFPPRTGDFPAASYRNLPESSTSANILIWRKAIKSFSSFCRHHFSSDLDQINNTFTFAFCSLKQGTEHDYREKLKSLEAEKYELEQRLQEANQALDLADSHLQQEIEKIKLNLEQEYNRRYANNQKQHPHNLQQLPKEIEKQQSIISPIYSSDHSLQDTEEIKKMYRTEIDRLYRKTERLEFSNFIFFLLLYLS